MLFFLFLSVEASKAVRPDSQIAGNDKADSNLLHNARPFLKSDKTKTYAWSSWLVEPGQRKSVLAEEPLPFRDQDADNAKSLEVISNRRADNTYGETLGSMDL